MDNKDEKSLVDSGSLGRMYALSQFDNFFKEIHDSFWKRFDNLFENWDLNMQAFDSLQPKGGFPKVNVIESEKSYDVEIAVAGFDKDDVELELKDNALFIKADKHVEKCDGDDEECKTYLTKEIASRSFRRTVVFPGEINVDDISASYENGIITCKIGKAEIDLPSSIKIDIK
jgi:HSP20 family protein